MRALYLIIILFVFIGCSKKLPQDQLNEINQKIKSDSLNSELYYQRAEFLREKGSLNNNVDDIKRAIEDYTKAIELDSAKTDYYTGRSIAYANLGEYLKSIEDTKTIIKVSPEETYLSYAVIGKFFYVMGEYDSTIYYEDKAIKSKDDDIVGSALHYKAHSYWFLAKYDKAVEIINDYLKKDIDDNAHLDLIKFRAIMHEQSNNKRAALNDYLEIKRLNNNKAENLAFDFAIANKYIDLSKPDSAKIYWNKVKNYKELSFDIFKDKTEFDRTIYFRYNPEIISARIDSLFNNNQIN